MADCVCQLFIGVVNRAEAVKRTSSKPMRTEDHVLIRSDVNQKLIKYYEYSGRFFQGIVGRTCTKQLAEHLSEQLLKQLSKRLSDSKSKNMIAAQVNSALRPGVLTYRCTRKYQQNAAPLPESLH